MILTDLHIHRLRNINSAKLKLHPKINIFVGANGSGKTSVLESLYVLCTGLSFRTREIASLIQESHDQLILFAQTNTLDTISVQKTLMGNTCVRKNKQRCQSRSELARFLPCQLIYQDIFNIMDAGPSVRRNLLDWGMFHVKHDFHPLWQNYRRTLKHRNALLRQKANQREFIPWDNMLATLSCELHTIREVYFKQWSEAFYEVLPRLTNVSCSIHYHKGWDRKNTGKALIDVLKEQFASDVVRQYTQSGAHQADIIFRPESAIKAKRLYSRGQQKILLIALKLAQTQLLGAPCLYLVDDVFAELDKTHQHSFLKLVSETNGQWFLTHNDVSDDSMWPQLTDFSKFKLQTGEIKDVSRET